MENVKTFFRMFKQLNSILGTREKRKAVIVMLLSIINAFLETLGISAMVPFIIAMLQPASLLKYETINKMVSILRISSEDEMITFVGIGVVIIFAVKNAFILFFNRYRLNFRNSLERDLSVNMLNSYMVRPYSFFLKTNSSEVIRGVTADNVGVAAVLDSYCTLINEGLTCSLIGIVLAIINPVLALGILVLACIIALLSVILLRKRISGYASKAREAFAERYKYAYETIEGVKEIEVMKRQHFFLERYRQAATQASNINTRYLWISMLPSRVTEAAFLSGLVIIVLISRRYVEDVSILAAQLSAVAVAAIRVLPSISNISGAMNGLVYNRLALESACENIRECRANKESLDVEDLSDKKTEFQNSIVVNNISWRYEGKHENVLENLSIEIKKGEAIGIIGESGAGKTTLADIILGLFIPQIGEVTVDGMSIYDKDTGWHKMIGYVPQNVYLLDDTIRNNILFGIDENNIDEERIQRVLEQSQLIEFVNNQPSGLNTYLGERGVKISGGQRQRIAIARALYYDPEILVLDEATSALDNETENAVIEAINALHGDKTLVIIAHRLTTIDKCDKVFEVTEKKAVLRRKNQV